VCVCGNDHLKEHHIIKLKMTLNHSKNDNMESTNKIHYACIPLNIQILTTTTIQFDGRFYHSNPTPNTQTMTSFEGEVNEKNQCPARAYPRDIKLIWFRFCSILYSIQSIAKRRME